MLLIIGYLIVFFSAIGGFMMAGGNPIVLLHLSEIVIICGIAIGILVIASPASVLKDMIKQLQMALKGAPVSREDYMDLLKLQYELFSKARRGGLVSIEDDILEPAQSPILSKYPSFLKDHHRVEALRNSLRPVIDGRVRPEHLHSVIESELETIEAAEEKPAHILQLVADSLPGVGIVAAVMGIINTMNYIALGPEKVGLKVAAALTGTFLGVFLAYGFVNPLSQLLKNNNAMVSAYYQMIMKGCVGFVNGMAPIMAVELARRCIQPDLQPTADEMEEAMKSLGSGG